MAVYSDSRQPAARRRMVAAAAAGVLGLAAVLALGIWQLGANGSGNGKVVTARPQLAPVAPQTNGVQQSSVAPQSGVSGQRGASGSGLASASASGTASRRTAASQLIVVDSASRAAEITQAMDQAEVIRSQLGEPALDYTVVQVNGEEEANAALRAVADENAVRAVLGLPEIQVSDLRTAPASSSIDRRDAVGGFAESLNDARQSNAPSTAVRSSASSEAMGGYAEYLHDRTGNALP